MAFRTRRQQRYERYKDSGFLPFEARSLSKIPFSHAPFMRQAFTERRDLLKGLKRQADQLNWSTTQYETEKKQLIAYDYKDKGLVYTEARRGVIRLKGRPDPWQLFRYYRDEAIGEGKWAEETPRYRKRRKRLNEYGVRIDKGNVQEQKARRRERNRGKKDRG